MNYFNLFNLPQKFELNIDDLTFRYYKLQKQFHPDAYNQRKLTETNIDLYSKKSILLNKGYQTLKNVLTRTEHLLFLNNIKICKKEKITFDSKFLIMQLELFEQLEQQKKKRNKHEINHTLIKIKETEKKYINKLKYLCDIKKWKLAQNLLYKLFFFNKFSKKIKEVLQKIES